MHYYTIFRVIKVFRYLFFYLKQFSSHLELFDLISTLNTLLYNTLLFKLLHTTNSEKCLWLNSKA